MTANRGRKLCFVLVAVVGATLVPYLVAEGVYAVMKGPQAETSLAYSYYASLRSARGPAETDPPDPSTGMITSLAQIEPLLALMKASGVGLGNSPFSELKTEATSINSDLGECRVQKPNLRKTVGFLRTNLFNPFDQMTFFYDADRVLPAELEAFFSRYAFRRVTHTTNESGERRTLPVVDSSRKVLIAGDSVANGVMLDDTETLASQLQARDPDRQYVNLGISGAKAADTACALDRAAARYHGQIDELIYVLCENDWSASEKYGQPDALAGWLVSFQRRESLSRVTLLYVPYIYNTAPEITRLRGHLHHQFPTYHEEKHRMLELARQAGFRVVDYLDITNDERNRLGTQFASLALYLDHAHPSRVGVERLLPYLLEGKLASNRD